MLFHFKDFAALCDLKIKWVISLQKKVPKFNLNLLSQAAQESDDSGFCSSSASSLTDALRIYSGGAAVCILDAGARREITGESEGCVGSTDCATCFQKQRGNHHHVRFRTAVKPAMVRVCLVKSAAHFFPSAQMLLTFMVIVMKPLWRAPGSSCGSDCSLMVRPMKHTRYFTVSIPGNKLKGSAGPYVDVAPRMEPCERIQVSGVNFIKLLVQSAIS